MILVRGQIERRGGPRGDVSIGRRFAVQSRIKSAAAAAGCESPGEHSRSRAQGTSHVVGPGHRAPAVNGRLREDCYHLFPDPRHAEPAIRRNLPEYLRDFFEFAFLTGVRKRQLAGTIWGHLNTEAWVLTWKDPKQEKNRQPHGIALDGRPLEIIRDRWEARKSRGDLACPYIFDNEGKPIGDFKRAWATACRTAGFPVGRKNGDYVSHNTRHTAVTNLVNAGVPAHEAMGMSGHRTRSAFDRYSIKLHEQTRAALRKATDYVHGLSTEPKVVQLPSHHKTGRRDDPVHAYGTHLPFFGSPRLLSD